MDILMTTWDGAGNTPPMMSVVAALIGRGHSVRVMADPTMEDEVAATGASYRAWVKAPARHRRGPEGDFVKDWEGDQMQGFGQLRDRLAVGAAGPFADEVLEEIGRKRPDLLLTEMFLFGAMVAGEASGVPTVVLNPTIAVVPRPGVPPFGPGLLPPATPEEEKLHQQISEASAAAWNEALPELNAARAAHGLAPLSHVLEQNRAARKTLVLTSEAFDFPGELPPGMVYVGPRLDDPSWVGGWTPPAGDAPLALVSFSSDFQNQQDLLARTVRALGEVPVRGLVTTGWGVDPDTLEAPSNVEVVRSAPHSEVLSQAAVVVTHCGHGSTIKALAAGVPLVCIPQGRDQFDVAARVVHAGAGVRVDPSAESKQIAAAVSEVLADPGYREAAERLAKAIADETATDRAVEEIEASGLI